jgi:predicted MFS family arabinose efflux permease
MIPVVWLWVPETVAFLERKRPAGALAAINRTLSDFRHASIGAFPRVDQDETKRSIMDIFRPGLVAATLTITLAYFAHITSFYFIIKWVPKIVVDMGFEPSAAAGVLMWTNVGCASGGALIGLIALRTGLKPVTLAALCGSTLMIIWFGSGADNLTRLSMMVFVVGCLPTAQSQGCMRCLPEYFQRMFVQRAQDLQLASGVVAPLWHW